MTDSSDREDAVFEGHLFTVTKPRDVPVWRTVTIGKCAGRGIGTKIFERLGCYVSSSARKLFRQIVTAERFAEIKLVRVSVAELGFPDGARFGEICERASMLGLGLCSHEIGPALRLQYRDQPLGEGLTIASEPLMDFTGNPSLFFVCGDERGQSLREGSAKPNRRWKPAQLFIFTLQTS